MIPRQEKIKRFKEFYDESQELFTNLTKSSKHHERLKNLYAFNICPGGWDGGINEKVIDVFYGNRPIDIRKEVKEDFRIHEVFESASGAALHYERNDDGNIICYLYPARSENQRPVEDYYLLDYINKPEALKKKAKSHVNKFIAYMESTCIDGEPNLRHRFIVFLLRNFYEYVESGVLKESRFKSLSKWLAKYTLTVGLSGFVILIVTWFKDADSIKDTNEFQNKSLIELKKIEQHSGRSVSQQAETNKALTSLVENNKNTNNKIDALLDTGNNTNNSLSSINAKIELMRKDITGSSNKKLQPTPKDSAAEH